MYDEPDNGLVLTINAPNPLQGVGNGRLIKTKKYNKTHTSYVWEVKNPINNYGVNINIGDYTNWTDVYEGEKGKLDLSFWVLKDDLKKAKEQFKDAYLTLEALEYWFGPYPFYEDSYKLVQVPYLGMEHQSSVTYGNKFMKGYLGRDLSGTGVGLNWDFIIIHESGHEWFANNITYKDAADMWIHEGFTSYSESLFIEFHFGQEDAYRYSRGLRSNIENKMPVVGPYDVNQEGSKDMYYKGHNMLHTIRQIVNDSDKWREILRGLNEEYYHSTVTTADIENYISEKSGIDFSPVFDQYLRDIRIPVFEYRVTEGGMVYRFANVIEDFEMKVKLKINGEEQWLTANDQFKFLRSTNAIESVELDNNFYVIPYDMTVE
jgi:aminopeptidase N